MTIPFVFRNPAADNNVNFDFDDIVDGFKIKRYYACTYADDSGESHILTDNAQWVSKSLETTANLAANTNDPTKLIDLDFDGWTMEKTLIIGGQGSIQFKYYIDLSSSDNNGGYAIFKLRKWDGAAETEIASVQTETFTDDSTIGEFTIPITVPRTQINKGEQLRLTVEGWGENDSISTALTLILKHDPQTSGNELILNLPKATI